jgi:hypothetical protein
MVLRSRVLLFVFSLTFLSVPTLRAEELDQDLKPPEMGTKEINRFFEDVVVVQRRARPKAKKILFNPFFSIDFSDGPTTFYSASLSLGYALSDYWEVYLAGVPYFISNERDIVGRVSQLTLEGGKKASIQYLKPKYQLMAEVLWAPAYGKDSWGPTSIVRSDTFLKVGGGTIFYEEGEQGLRANLSMGKTFFFHDLFNLRVGAGASFIQSIVDHKKQFFFTGIFEFGFICYI